MSTSTAPFELDLLAPPVLEFDFSDEVEKHAACAGTPHDLARCGSPAMEKNHACKTEGHRCQIRR
jgi:hypothetical protein